MTYISHYYDFKVVVKIIKLYFTSITKLTVSARSTYQFHSIIAPSVAHHLNYSKYELVEELTWKTLGKCM